ncbi:type III secretion protein [Lampropedia aestuarii]|uniref:Type III secretion protein n=1 Tax=Lampropedia aestuarii TaxID=2562762 RepID=A0A4S5BGR7_9BURK|nr:YscO family type III secretion system apparatus protein [Lampropedia aestuarii]MDH5857338.1 YscO family type III secretion system apparatus protein [Lampropedia aestuarii]THJ31547.1 type III secretion protein [Lampropedia aestuarii]
MSLFGELIRIKRLREDKAERHMYQSRQQAQQAREAHLLAQSHLQHMVEQGQQIEQQLYADLFSRQVRVREIDAVHQELAQMRQCEMQQEQVVCAAAEQVAVAQNALRQAREGHQIAQRQTSKFVDLSASFDIQRQRESDRLEDLEMEEAASVRRERDDWDGLQTDEEQP